MAGIVQARMGSKRLPGKSMVEIEGRPSLGYLLESLLRVFAPQDLWLVTSTLPGDDVIAEFAGSLGIQVVRGDEKNVASRFLEVVKSRPYDYFLRFCGDSPFYDHRIAQQGISIAKNTSAEFDVITSKIRGGYPIGMSLEVIKAKSFVSAYPVFYHPDHFEHVTQYFYREQDKYKVFEVGCDVEGYAFEKYKFSIDTPDDLTKIRMIAARMTRPHWQYAFADLCRLHDTVSEALVAPR